MSTAASTEVQEGPKSLNPRSRAFLVPFGIGVAVLAIAWFGLKSIERSSGPWAVQAARKGVAESGLPASDRAALTVQVERLAAAVDSGAIDARAAVGGVDGLLKDPLIPLLQLVEVRDGRLAASGLDEAERAAARGVLDQTLSMLDAGLLNRGHAVKILGPLLAVPEDGTPPALDDAGLRALVARAKAEVEGVNPGLVKETTLAPVSRDGLLARFRERIDGVVE